MPTGVRQVTHETDQLFDLALKLPQEARAALAGTLLDSLDGPVDEAAEESWSAEIQRRLRALDTGRVQTIPWLEARRRIVAD